MAEVLRREYHTFLNTPHARDVDPIDLFEYLRPNRVLDEEEENIIRNEKTLASRQYWLFFRVLPSKGPWVKEIVRDALQRCGHTTAAQEWRRCTTTENAGETDTTDNIIRVVQAEQFHAAAPVRSMVTHHYRARTTANARAHSEEPKESFEELGARVTESTISSTTSSSAAIVVEEPAVRVLATAGLELRSPHGAPPPRPPPIGFKLPPPPESVTRLLRTTLVQVAAPLSREVPEAPSAPPMAQILPEDEVEEIVERSYIGTLSGPPTTLTARGGSDRESLDSMGIPLRTPESFFETQPSFMPKSKVAADAARENALSMKDVQLGNEIGRGFYAVVYVGQFSGRKVAVKKFRDYDEFSLAMFIEEINIMKDLNHKNVVKFIGYVHSPEDRQLWLLSEFVAGGALRRFCTPVGNRTELERSLPLRDKLKIAMDCWNGLDYIHSKSLCHKDISPGNILVSNDLTQVKISDFGLAEFKNVIMTAMTQVSGTPMYYPPEFASQDGVIRHPVKSDIYSMGACLCELFSEQWFWNIGGQPRSQFQVMFVLSEAQRMWTEKHEAKEPDCWPKVPALVQPMLRDAIMPDYRKRKSARDLALASQELLKEVK